MPSAWPTRCYPSENYSSLATSSTGTENSSRHSNSRNSPSSMKSRTESKSLTKPSLHAWPQTGQNTGLVTGCSRSTAPVPLMTSSAANKAGRSPCRFTHAAESRCTPIEGEALAVADAVDKARHFVLGCKNLTVTVDHQPLLKIFGDRSLDNISNTRLRNLKEKTLRYCFKMVYIPGVKNKAADTMSRHPSGDT